MTKHASAMRSKINKTEGSARKNRENLSSRQILAALRALKRGDFKLRLPDDYSGIDGEIAGVFNELVSRVSGFANDLGRLRVAVGKDGRTDQRLHSPVAAGGGWSDYIVHINEMLNDLTTHTDEMARVIT